MSKKSKVKNKNRSSNILEYDKLSVETRNCYLFLGTSIASAILHNVFYAIFSKEEAMFFFLTFLALIGFVYCTVKYTYLYYKSGVPKDIWKLGYIGFFGLVGLLINFEALFYIFIFFFLFFVPKIKK